MPQVNRRKFASVSALLLLGVSSGANGDYIVAGGVALMVAVLIAVECTNRGTAVTAEDDVPTVAAIIAAIEKNEEK